MIFPTEIFQIIVRRIPDALTLLRLSCCTKALRSLVEEHILYLTRLHVPWKRRRLKTSLSFAFYSQTESHCARCGRVADYFKKDGAKRCPFCGPGCHFRHSLTLLHQAHYKSLGPKWYKTNVRMIHRTTILIKDVRFVDFNIVRGYGVVKAVNQLDGLVFVVAFPRTDDLDRLVGWAEMKGYEVGIIDDP